MRHSWKLLANRITRDPKILIHGNSCIILYIYNGEIKKNNFSNPILDRLMYSILGKCHN